MTLYAAEGYAAARTDMRNTGHSPPVGNRDAIARAEVEDAHHSIAVFPSGLSSIDTTICRYVRVGDHLGVQKRRTPNIQRRPTVAAERMREAAATPVRE